MTEHITEKYTLAGVQHLIRRILDTEASPLWIWPRHPGCILQASIAS